MSDRMLRGVVVAVLAFGLLVVLVGAWRGANSDVSDNTPPQTTECIFNTTGPICWEE